jgi:hypothetical protein
MIILFCKIPDLPVGLMKQVSLSAAPAPAAPAPATIAAAAAAAAVAGKPFYIQVAPIGCHDACYVDEDFNGYLTPPLPAPRHAKLYADVNLPIRPNHNEDDVSDKPAWLQAVPK